MSTITKLNQWLQAGLITPAQHANILSFEAEHRQHSNGWLYSFMILGAAIIGLGVISLIAANWANIPANLKLGVDFALLTLLAIGVFWQYPKRHNGLWFEVLLVGFMLLCLATIGLIAQLYHLNGKWYHALVFWAAITFLLSLFARNLLTRFGWVTLLLQGLIWSLMDFTTPHLGLQWEILPAVFLLAPLLTAVLYYATMHSKLLHGFTHSLFFWFQLTAIIALAFADIVRSGGEMTAYQVAWFVPAYIAAALLSVGILRHKAYRWLNRVLLLGIVGLLLLYYHPDWLFNGQTDDIRAPLLTLTILFLYALHAGNSGHQRTFNLVTFLIGLRFVILYFQAMGGLAASGVGLIISGSLIIGITWLWYKGRDRLREWTKRLQG
ncbi:MAG: hypothetical protein BWK73_43950 [Thiothrix lacustris]|uniref:DUF2157 domain-containing protein n=1 Tax=Thiothrix lacustris TaxID=525917 RepID=A0A1Y1QBI7_9GAMM|nr:MAG: hypothetical protein BWK73_43950 [Thiothrix lacustris]